MRKFLIPLLIPLVIFAQGKMLYTEKVEGMSFEDVKILLKTALDGKNMNVLAVQDVSQNPKMTVFYVCNLSYGEKILRTFPEFGALAPCRIYVLEKPDGSVEIGYINIPNLVKGFKKYLSPQAKKVFLKADKDIKEAIKEVKGEF
ncbi:MAG: hypothetical protein DSY32_00640 [Aquifex sp.]|nr:MAG: hypothetical protein DSY32_00640 [Aquifex sp.]